MTGTVRARRWSSTGGGSAGAWWSIVVRGSAGAGRLGTVDVVQVEGVASETVKLGDVDRRRRS